MSQKKTSLSDQLRQLIETAEVSRYRISQQTGISQSLLSRFIHDTAGLSVDSLDKLAEALGLQLIKTPKPAVKSRKKK